MYSIKTVNPTNNELVKGYPELTPDEINDRITQAEKAFKTWRKTAMQKRAELLFKMADLMIERKEELARICALEMGKRLVEGIGEVEVCAGIFRYYAENGARLLADKPIETPLGKAFLTYNPLGIILSVQPWNFPFYQITRSAAPNLMAGNVVLLKHASNVPHAAEVMEALFKEAGAVPGVYTNLFIPGSKISELLNDPRISGASLTGSEPAGSDFASIAGKNIIKSTLELGGSDAFIVMPDADVNEAVKTAGLGRLWNAGQVCCSPKRIIVHEKMADAFIEKSKKLFEKITVGDPLDPKTELGPLSSQSALDTVLNQVDQAIKQGAKLIAGGKQLNRPGAFMEPTILTGIQKGMNVYAEEVFGPVLMIYAVKDIATGIELANDTRFGLGGTVFGPDMNAAIEVARQMDTGMVYINHVTGIGPELPFGGTKKSGYGREQAEEGIYEFVNSKLIRVTSPAAPY